MGVRFGVGCLAIDFNGSFIEEKSELLFVGVPPNSGAQFIFIFTTITIDQVEKLRRKRLICGLYALYRYYIKITNDSRENADDFWI